MKNLSLLMVACLLTTGVSAQFTPPSPTKGIGKISGKVLDSQTQQIVEFATISLYVQATNQLIDGTITDEKGNFSLSQLKDNTYKVEVSFLGYETTVLENVTMVREKNVDLGDIAIVPTAKNLEEVVVTGDRALIEEKVDRLVYNAENDKLAQGGDAADILRKVPLLQVDLEGNVSIRGQSNIRVLINNKPSTIVASSVADALKMLPADQIVKVEVITSPSAKYDAEGSGGIINIITKKDRMEGYFLNVNAGVGMRASTLGLDGSFRKGKFGMSLGGHGRLFYNKAETDMSQTTLVNGMTYTTHQFNPTPASDNGVFGRYNLALNYDIDKTQFLSAGVNYGVRRFDREQEQMTELYNDAVLLSSTLRSISELRPSNSIDANLDYLKTFKPEQEWSISTLYSRNSMNENFTSDMLDLSSAAVLSSLRNESDNLNQEMTIQTDFQTPIGENQQFEIGVKDIFRVVNSNFAYYLLDANEVYQPDLSRPAGSLDYQQNVTAAYSTYSFSTKNKISLKLGIRWEQTAVSATQNGEDIDIPSYNNFVPTLNISKSFKNFSTLKLGYNRRIQRPWLQQLNPNFNVVNAQDIRVGNPNLSPELTDNLELSYSTMVKNSYLNLSVFGRNTNNAINEVRYPLDSVQGAILTTFENIGSEKAVGLNVFTNINLSEKWTLNGGFDVYYAFLEGQILGADGNTITATNQGLNYGGRLMSQLKLANGWTAQAFAFMHGRRVQLQGYRGGFGMYSLGINKDFKNKSGSVGISFDNFLGKGWVVRSEMQSPTFSQTSEMLLYNSNIRLTFSYKLGKLDFRETVKKTKSIQNDDIKGGNGNDGGGNTTGGGNATPQQQPARKGMISPKSKKDGEKETKPTPPQETPQKKEQ